MPVGMGEGEVAKVGKMNLHVCLGPSRKKGHTSQNGQLPPSPKPGPESGECAVAGHMGLPLRY